MIEQDFIYEYKNKVTNNVFIAKPLIKCYNLTLNTLLVYLLTFRDRTTFV